MFDNAPPEYYGDSAEVGEGGRILLEAERKAELAGTSACFGAKSLSPRARNADANGFRSLSAWEEAVSNLEDDLEDVPEIPFPSPHRIALNGPPAPSNGVPAAASAGKRKAPSGRAGGKKKKLEDGSSAAAAAATEGDDETLEDGADGEDATMADGASVNGSGARDADAGGGGGGFESVFSPEQLQAPKLLTAQEMEKAIVQRQKAILLEEYGVGQE